jgi:hypothetical protein
LRAARSCAFFSSQPMRFRATGPDKMLVGVGFPVQCAAAHSLMEIHPRPLILERNPTMG